PLQQLEAVLARHADVRHEHPGLLAHKRSEAVVGRGEGPHIEPGALQGTLEHPAYRLVVVHHPYGFRHLPCTPVARIDTAPLQASGSSTRKSVRPGLLSQSIR